MLRLGVGGVFLEHRGVARSCSVPCLRLFDPTVSAVSLVESGPGPQEENEVTFVLVITLTPV